MNAADLQDLPDEVREVIERPQKLRAEELAGLATHITTLRDEAVAARKESGIEQTWAECEEAYLGIDDLTRAEFGGAKWAKPMAMEGGLVKMTQPGDSTKATAFVMVTARYVDAGTAKVCEVSLPIDGKPFTLKATPVPELSAAAEDKTPAEQVTGQPLAQQMRQRIFEPLGMRQTFFLPQETVQGTLAHGYTKGTDITNASMSFAFATANIATTAEELQRFGRAVYGRSAPSRNARSDVAICEWESAI